MPFQTHTSVLSSQFTAPNIFFQLLLTQIQLQTLTSILPRRSSPALSPSFGGKHCCFLHGPTPHSHPVNPTALAVPCPTVSHAIAPICPPRSVPDVLSLPGLSPPQVTCLPAPGCPVLIVSPRDYAFLSRLGPRVWAIKASRGPSQGGPAQTLGLSWGCRREAAEQGEPRKEASQVGSETKASGCSLKGIRQASEQ